MSQLEDRYRALPSYRQTLVQGAPHLTLKQSVGKPIVNYKIGGQSVQNGTPTPENPIEIQSLGRYNSSTGKYEIDLSVNSTKTTIALDAPPRRIGTVADTLNYGGQLRTNAVLRKILDGTETWYRWPDSPSYISAGSYGFYTIISNGLHTNAICSHFPNVSSVYVINVMPPRGGNETFTFNMPRTYNTVSDFTAWLAAQYAAGTPVTLYCQPATPTTEPVTLPEIFLPKGTATITVTDGTLSASSTEVTYYKGGTA